MLTLESSDEHILNEMRRIRELYQLKKTLRYESERSLDVHSESVAEHIFAMLILVDYFLPLEDPEGKLDRLKIHELILYHEIGEIDTGDIISHKKSEEQTVLERVAAENVAKRLPDGLTERAYARFLEFEDSASEEAAFATAIDKLEPIFEMLPESSWPYYKKHNMNREISVGKKMVATERYPYMRRFLDAWTAHMVSNNVFVD